MIFSDTHTHLYLDDFDADRAEMIQRAIDNGVRYMFMPNIDKESLAPMLQIAEDHPGVCYAMVGLHPTSVKEDVDEQWELIQSVIPDERIIAIGECGIDLYWDKSYAASQERIFERHLQWSLDTGWPLSVHIRDGFPTVFNILDKYRNTGLKGVFHCFSGGMEEAEKAISYGFHLGIGGVITFRNSGLSSVIKEISPDKIVLESDAPFLAPVPHRGKRNEPSYIPVIAEKLAEIWNIPLSVVADVTTANAIRIFNPFKR